MKNIIITISLFLFVSCSKSLEKELIITDFTKEREIYFQIDEQRSMSTNINLEISGYISDTIFYNRIGSDSTRYPIIPKELPIRLMSDYYGSPGKIGYKFYASRTLKGDLKIMLQIP